MNQQLLVVDASVAAKWFLPEEDMVRARRLLELARDGDILLLAPDLLVAEVGNITWKRVKQGELQDTEPVDIIKRLATIPFRWTNCRDLVQVAVALAVDIGCTVYDAMYLALAEAHDTQVITADRRLAEAIPQDWGAQRVALLNEFAD